MTVQKPLESIIYDINSMKLDIKIDQIAINHYRLLVGCDDLFIEVYDTCILTLEYNKPDTNKYKSELKYIATLLNAPQLFS